MTRPPLNLLDKAALGIALLRLDTDPVNDKWALYVGKGFIAIAMAGHLGFIYKNVLNLPMPPEGTRPAMMLALIALCYVPVHLVTHPVEEIQQVRLSRRARWKYRGWGLLLSPLSWSVWGITYLAWVFIFGGTPN